jgi:hypothetical protein
MADLTDAELPGYCEIHCRTERALFHSSHFNRLVALAGHPANYLRSLPEGFYCIRDDQMDELVELAQARMKDHHGQ